MYCQNASHLNAERSKADLDNIRPSDLPSPPPFPCIARLSRSFSTEEIVLRLLHGHNWHHIESLHVPSEQIGDLDNVLIFHLSEARQRCLGLQLIHTDHACEGHVAGNVRELGLDEFWYVERAMVVPANRYGCRNNDTSSVDGLKDPFEMALARNFLDEDGREALRTELLVYTEVVDLADWDDTKWTKMSDDNRARK